MTKIVTTPADAVAPFADIKMHHATRAKAQRLFAQLIEWPMLTLEAETDEDEEGTPVLINWTVSHDDGDDPIYDGDKLPELADLLEAAQEQGLSLEVEEPEEEAGNVVAEKYRIEYKLASTNGQTCGDWLAEWLVAQTHGGEGFNVADFTAILISNDVDMRGKWAGLPESGQKGWIGRYRMNGRQVLEKVVALRGTITDIVGSESTVPAEALSILRTKHAAYIAKINKAAQAALAPKPATNVKVAQIKEWATANYEKSFGASALIETLTDDEIDEQFTSLTAAKKWAKLQSEAYQNAQG
jgi:hypothetical protein